MHNSCCHLMYTFLCDISMIMFQAHLQHILVHHSAQQFPLMGAVPDGTRHGTRHGRTTFLISSCQSVTNPVRPPQSLSWIMHADHHWWSYAWFNSACTTPRKGIPETNFIHHEISFIVIFPGNIALHDLTPLSCSLCRVCWWDDAQNNYSPYHPHERASKRMCTLTNFLFIGVTCTLMLQIITGGMMHGITTPTTTPMKGPPAASPATGPLKMKNGPCGRIATSLSKDTPPVPALCSTSAPTISAIFLMRTVTCQLTQNEFTGAYWQHTYALATSVCVLRLRPAQPVQRGLSYANFVRTRSQVSAGSVCMH